MKPSNKYLEANTYKSCSLYNIQFEKSHAFRKLMIPDQSKKLILIFFEKNDTM